MYEEMRWVVKKKKKKNGVVREISQWEKKEEISRG